MANPLSPVAACLLNSCAVVPRGPSDLWLKSVAVSGSPPVLEVELLTRENLIAWTTNQQVLFTASATRCTGPETPGDPVRTLRFVRFAGHALGAGAPVDVRDIEATRRIDRTINYVVRVPLAEPVDPRETAEGLPFFDPNNSPTHLCVRLVGTERGSGREVTSNTILVRWNDILSALTSKARSP